MNNSKPIVQHNGRNVMTPHLDDEIRYVQNKMKQELETNGFQSGEHIRDALIRQRRAGMYDAYCDAVRECDAAHWSVRWISRLTIKRKLMARMECL